MYHKTFALTVRALRVDARNLAPHLMRAGLAFFVLLCLMAANEDFSAMAPGRNLFGWIIYTNVLFATLVVPMLFASAITEEKEERTLPLLLIANVSPLTILSGKAVPRLTSVFLIFCIQIPFSLLAITLGGITLKQVAAAYCAVAAYIVFAGLLALWCSVILRLTANSMGLAGILLLAYHLVPLIVWAIASALVAHPTFATLSQTSLSLLGDYYWHTNIFWRLQDILASGYDGGVLLSGGTVIPQIWSNLAAGLFFFVLSWLSFSIFNSETDSAPVKRRSQAARRSSRKRRVWHWALVWKEFYFSNGGTTFVIAKLILYGGLILLCGFAFANWNWRQLDMEEMAAAAGIMMFFIFLPMEITLSVGKLFYPEVKHKTLSSLYLLPQSTWQIAYTKLLGIVPGLIPCFVYLGFSLLYHFDVVFDFFESFARDPIELSLTYFNTFSHFLLYLHLVVLLSLRMNSWWAAFVAGVIHYFGVVVPMMVFFMVIGLLGMIPNEVVMYGAALVMGFAATAAAVGLHFLIGKQLNDKAAGL